MITHTWTRLRRGLRGAAALAAVAALGSGCATTSFHFDNGVADGYQQAGIGVVGAMMIGCQGEPLTPFTELSRRT